jgi:hypothetical protein
MREHYEQPQYLTFHVAGEEYAAAILRVKEIIEFGAVTKVPTMPEFVRGVITSGDRSCRSWTSPPSSGCRSRTSRAGRAS